MARLLATSLLSVIVLGLSLTPSLRAEVREAASMKEVAPHVDQDTLLILDLDNTVAKTPQSLGSDQWFDYEVRKAMAAGKSEKEANDLAIRPWNAVQKATRVLPVEAWTPEWIAEVQAKGVQVMALTARPMDLAEATFKQLSSIGVDFTGSPPVHVDVSVRAAGDDVELGRYVRGILFQGPDGKKGETLVQFLRQTHVPKKIVFVDDRPHNVHSVDQALTHAKIPNLEFRYGAVDPIVRAFDPEITDVAWKVFEKSGKILSDAEAKALGNSPCAQAWGTIFRSTEE